MKMEKEILTITVETIDETEKNFKIMIDEENYDDIIHGLAALIITLRQEKKYDGVLEKAKKESLKVEYEA